MIQLISPSQSAFASSAWLPLYDQRLKVLQWVHDEGRAEMFVYETNRWGYRTLITPPYMPNTQLTFTGEVQFAAFGKALAEYCNLGNWSYWKFDFPIGNQVAADFPPTLNVREKYTYRIESLSNWRDMATSKLRNDINKMDRYHFQVNAGRANYIEFFKMKLASVGLKHVEILERSTLSDAFYFIEEKEGRYVACCVHQGDVVYYLAAANEKSDRTIATCGLAYCIDEALRKGARVFDFEGSMIPGVEAYFKKFGGSKHHYISVENGRGWKYRLRKFLRK